MTKEVDIVVFSNPKRREGEEQTVTRMFEEGLEYFHLRKPNYSKQELREWIEAIPQKYRNRIIIHSYHRLAVNYGLKGIHLTRKHRKSNFSTYIKCKFIRLMRADIAITCSFHSLSKLFDNKQKYDYVFLSPVFNSISKKEYKTAFKASSLKQRLGRTQRKIVALGGLTVDNVEKAVELGFKGVAFLGALWDNEDPLSYYLAIKKKVSGPSWDANVKKITKKINPE